MEDGDVISVGDVGITVLDAPGCTSKMVNYRIDDEVILTGDARFVDSVGHTELEFGEEGAETEYETLHGTLMEQPDDITVLPGHPSQTTVTTRTDPRDNPLPHCLKRCEIDAFS